VGDEFRRRSTATRVNEVALAIEPTTEPISRSEQVAF
jgi:hypothetical protein